MKVVAIIPARIASTRLPRKILREIRRPDHVQRVYEAARGCGALADVIVPPIPTKEGGRLLQNRENVS